MKAETPLKNGLTPAQVDKAREILNKVSKEKIYKALNISPATIQNVLRGNSSRIDQLKLALDEAHRVIDEKEKLLASIPV